MEVLREIICLRMTAGDKVTQSPGGWWWPAALSTEWSSSLTLRPAGASPNTWEWTAPNCLHQEPHFKCETEVQKESAMKLCKDGFQMWARAACNALWQWTSTSSQELWHVHIHWQLHTGERGSRGARKGWTFWNQSQVELSLTRKTGTVKVWKPQERKIPCKKDPRMLTPPSVMLQRASSILSPYDMVALHSSPFSSMAASTTKNQSKYWKMS